MSDGLSLCWGRGGAVDEVEREREVVLRLIFAYGSETRGGFS